MRVLENLGMNNLLARLPFYKNEHLVSFNFNANLVKMVCVKNVSGKTEILGIKACNIDGLTEDDAAKAIKEALKEYKITNPAAVCNISADSVITKNIEMPSVKDAEIKGIIDLQAGRYTPYGRNEIIVDYVNIGTYHNSYSKVLIVIVVQETIKKQLSILNKAGFSVQKVQVSSESIGCACAKIMGLLVKVATSVIVSVDDKNSDFVVVFKGKTIFLRNIPMGQLDFLRDPQECKAKFVEEIGKSLVAYRTEDIETAPDEILFIGPADMAEVVKSAALQVFSIPVREVSLYSGVSVSGKFLGEKNQQSFANAISAIMSFNDTRIDLRPIEIKMRMEFHERSREVIKCGIFVMSILVLICVILMASIYYKGVYLSKLEVKLKDMDTQVEGLEKTSTKVMIIKSFLNKKNHSLDLLSELYRLVPDNIYLRSVSVDGKGAVNIKGTATAMSEAFSFVTALENSKFFKNVAAQNTSSRKEGAKEVSDFEITCMLEAKL